MSASTTLGAVLGEGARRREAHAGAERLRISRARVSVLSNRGDFPRPIGRLGRSHVWRWSTIERWARDTRRLNPTE
jgi:predicted DNA-binding transcriptional regulator AlpA